ncbi:efflux RND transporter periplasmic adaptor subunit [Altererythrobacter sp. CC-YST694]|uniref:efflux RND transporter periplasmic adaptor subunit n=1 Tax=Altererythrobacter sp. CC-YST694 TaxID=2755038 RepID=UPI001D030C31|nr:efflux RND transporter periplasmic adaptor subunit [Altererythrobacter sp. CC-YST694]MCB5426468.1 efflux RND transporter periplasmic adaptor subunit [Altererythrobacter sp. CC-YST694]
MKLTRKQILPVALIVLLLAVAGYWMFAPREREVAAIRVEAEPATRILAVNGRIRPRLQVDIRPSLGGELVALPFDVGDRVAEGQVLARIDDAPETAAIAEAEASVQAQQATLAQARRDLARFEALGQFATKREVEQRRLAVEEGTRELSRRRAGVVQAREQRDRRVLRAPFAGVIMERPVDPGQTVGLDSVIYRLADLSRPEVTVEVDEIYATEIRPGMDARISLPGQAQELRAVVAHVEPRVDPATGARDVRLSLVDPVVDAPSGLTVTVNLIIERRERAISVPRSALILSGGAGKVRVIGKDGVVSERPVSFIDWPAEEVIVTGGIRAGDRLLADPNAAGPGEKVKVAR